MAHYASCFAIRRLALNAHLGVPAAERARLQPIAISLRLYFPHLPESTSNDSAHFIDYAGLSDLLCSTVKLQQFRLIEAMAGALFAGARDYVNSKGGANVGLWLSLTKVAPEVEHLSGGASFILSDLPPGASVVAAE